MAEVQQTNLSMSGEMTQRFIEFIMMQAQHAALFLGQIAHPETGHPEINLDAAKMFIDQLEMIHEKTRGNLSSDETKILENTLTNLRMAFVQVSSGEVGMENDVESEVLQAPASAPKPAESASASTLISEADSKKKFSKSYGA